MEAGVVGKSYIFKEGGLWEGVGEGKVTDAHDDRRSKHRILDDVIHTRLFGSITHK